MDYSPPGSSVHGILQARILEGVAISFSRGSSQPRVWICISCIAGGLSPLSHRRSPWFADAFSRFVRCVFHSLNGFLRFTEGLQFVTVLLSVFSFAVVFKKSSASQHRVLPLFSSRRLTVSCPTVRSLIYLGMIFVCNLWGGGPSFFCCLWVSGFPSTICWRHYPVPLCSLHVLSRLTPCARLSLYQHHTVFHFIFWNSFLVKVTFIFSLLYYCYTGKNLYFLFRRNVSISHFLALFTALI